MSATIKFESYGDFEAFLETQQHQGFRMCQPRGTRYVKNATIAVRDYICVVEGNSRACSAKKRSISKLGSGSCGASFVARYPVDAEKKPHGPVSLTKVNLEHGHDPVFRAQAVPRGTRKLIDEKLSRGVGPERVASDLQADALKPENRETLRPNRVIFLKKAYFRARHRLLNAREIEMDKDEHRSVSLSVAERWADSTLCHHPLGTEGELAADIFCLIMSSPFQRHLLERYGGPSSIVFFDATHDTVKYRNFYMYTLLVVDEGGRGYPAAWMIANSKTAAIQAHFLKKLHAVVPQFVPGAIMVDEDAAARSAVCGVFPKSRLYLCDFHLSRSWKRKLSGLKIILAPEMTRHLAILRRSSCEGEFEASYLKLKEHLTQTPRGSRFWEYLLHNYMFNKKLFWAGCYRLFPYATNNHVESWHNQLKGTYLKRKSKVRLDQYIISRISSRRFLPSIALHIAY